MSANLCISNWSESAPTCRVQVSEDSEYAKPCEQLPKNFSFGRDVAQSGSAPEWGSGGRWFESTRPDQ